MTRDMTIAGPKTPCEACDEAEGLQWHVPEEIWAKLAPQQPYRMGTATGGILCLWCADERAEQLGMEVGGVRLYFCGNALHSQLYGDEEQDDE
jgi:hypothetical protein